MNTLTRAAFRSVILLSALSAVVPLSACSSSGAPEIGQGPYAGPLIEIDSTGAAHTVILTAPTGGWSFTLDQVRKGFDADEAFVTARRPDPAYMTTQALVRHEAATGIPVERGITVYARTIAHDATEGPYAKAGEATPD